MSLSLKTVRTYWLENLPETCRRLQAEGKLDSHLKETIDQAEDYLADLVSKGSTVSQAMEVALPIAFPASEEEVAREEKDWLRGEDDDDEPFDSASAEETVAYVNGDRSMPVVVMVDKHGWAKLV